MAFGRRYRQVVHPTHRNNGPTNFGPWPLHRWRAFDPEWLRKGGPGQANGPFHAQLCGAGLLEDEIVVNDLGFRLVAVGDLSKARDNVALLILTGATSWNRRAKTKPEP